MIYRVCRLLYRVSIQHVNFHRPFSLKTGENSSSAADEAKADAGQEDDVKVYPISSEGGYIIYHVGSTLTKQSLEEFPSYDALMSGADRVHDEVMIKNCVEASSLDFPIDTFGSRGSLDTNITASGKTTAPSVSAFSSVRRHSDDGTLRVFVETPSNDDDSDQRVCNSAETIVDGVISDIIDSVITRCLSVENDKLAGGNLSLGYSQHLSNGLDSVDDAPADTFRRRCDSVDCPSDLSSATVQTSGGDMSPTMHPLYAHILLYVRKFDTSRAMYALDRLRAILATSPNVIVRALTTSNVGGTSTLRAMLLQSLLVQHRRSILGRRFCSDDTESSVSGIRSSMFIDVLVTICLYYMRGYYPNLLAPSLTVHDVADNARLQVNAADILTTVLDELAVITRTGGRGFATYIFDLLDKCKVR